MTNKVFHILNGDCLKEQYPVALKGTKIVARECLVDGPVDGETLDDFFEIRANFISENYAETSKKDYLKTTVLEFEKITTIPEDSEVNLWFEDDLFCQVNFWFVLNLLKEKNLQLFLVRPLEHSQYGFGKYNQEELIALFQKRKRIQPKSEIFKLWKYYTANNLQKLKEAASLLQKDFPFILTAVEAHIVRIPSNNSEGKPKTTLRTIMDELQTKDFGIVFNEFNKRESIYGFGDLQVKRLFDEVINENSL